MIKKCCSNDVAAFALSHVTLYARTAIDGNIYICQWWRNISLP